MAVPLPIAVEQGDLVAELMLQELEELQLQVKVMLVEMQLQIWVETLVVAVADILLLVVQEQETVELQEDQELLEMVEQVYPFQVFFQEHQFVLLEAAAEALLDQVVHQM